MKDEILNQIAEQLAQNCTTEEQLVRKQGIFTKLLQKIIQTGLFCKTPIMVKFTSNFALSFVQ